MPCSRQRPGDVFTYMVNVVFQWVGCFAIRGCGNGRSSFNFGSGYKCNWANSGSYFWGEIPHWQSVGVTFYTADVNFIVVYTVKFLVFNCLN